MENLNAVMVVYILILFATLLYGILKLRSVRKCGDERQIALFYRASFDGMIGGIIGYLLAILARILEKYFSLPPELLSKLPSPIFIAVMMMFFSYKIRVRS